MRKEAQEWVEGLKDTLEARGHGYLRTSDGSSVEYCCLGLACEWSELGHWADEAEGSGTFPYIIPGSVVRPMNILPLAVQLQLGLRTNFGECLVDDGWLNAFHQAHPDTASKLEAYLEEVCDYRISLASLNDWLLPDGNPGMTFEDIANVIECEPPGLFDA